MPVRIEDISRRLGISVSTVSKALNGYPDVSAETRVRVLETARELDYHPSSAARNLRRKRSDKIGFILSYPVTAITEYAAELITGIVLAAEKAGYHIILYTERANRPEELIRICRARDVDGLILRGGRDTRDMARLLQKEKMPFVILGRRTPEPDVWFIAPDGFAGAVAVTRHLISLGHQRIAYIGRSELAETDVDRLAGYQEALEHAGIPFDPTLVVDTCSAEPESPRRATRNLLDLAEPPTAIFGMHDLVAVDALQVAIDRGLRVPDDVAIAGFDGIHTSALTHPPLTTVRQPLPEMGQQAVEMLLSQIAEPEAAAEQRIIPVQLVPRASTLGTTLDQAEGLAGEPAALSPRPSRIRPGDMGRKDNELDPLNIAVAQDRT